MHRRVKDVICHRNVKPQSNCRGQGDVGFERCRCPRLASLRPLVGSNLMTDQWVFALPVFPATHPAGPELGFGPVLRFWRFQGVHEQNCQLPVVDRQRHAPLSVTCSVRTMSFDSVPPSLAMCVPKSLFRSAPTKIEHRQRKGLSHASCSCNLRDPCKKWWMAGGAARGRPGAQRIHGDIPDRRQCFDSRPHL